MPPDELVQVISPVPTTYTVNLNAEPHEWITVVLTCPAGQGPHKPPEDTWAVRQLGRCLNDEEEWEWEPIPSSRDDEFLARTRWGWREATERALRVARREAR